MPAYGWPRKLLITWAKYLGMKVEEEFEVANGTPMAFVLIPPGLFWMGSPNSEPDHGGGGERLRKVRVTEPFYMGKYEVTQAQYTAVTGDNPSFFKGDNQPVEMVSQGDALAFAKKASAAARRPIWLPWEAEWEYACRGGRPSSMAFGVGESHTLTAKDANFADTHKSPMPVGSYTPNAFGLYDMHGNVTEFCADAWLSSFPLTAAAIEDDPRGSPANGSGRATCRGWGWTGQPAGAGKTANLRSAARYYYEAADRYSHLGFRVAAAPR